MSVIANALPPGTRIEVATAFSSANRKPVTLRIGLRGTVLRQDEHGDAQVKFDAVTGSQWVGVSDLDKLREVAALKTLGFVREGNALRPVTGQTIVLCQTEGSDDLGDRTLRCTAMFSGATIGVFSVPPGAPLGPWLCKAIRERSNTIGGRLSLVGGDGDHIWVEPLLLQGGKGVVTVLRRTRNTDILEGVGDPQCPKGHSLSRRKAQELYECDVCHRDIAEGKFVFYCEDCDYAMCKACVATTKALISTEVLQDKQRLSFESFTEWDDFTEFECTPEHFFAAVAICCQQAPMLRQLHLLSERFHCYYLDRAEDGEKFGASLPSGLQQLKNCAARFVAFEAMRLHERTMELRRLDLDLVTPLESAEQAMALAACLPAGMQELRMRCCRAGGVDGQLPCPQGHLLLKEKATVEYECDVCHRDIPKGKHVLTCEACDYAMCKNCAVEFPQAVLEAKRCPQGHLSAPYVMAMLQGDRMSWRCTVCHGDAAEGDDIFDCRSCDYTVCKVCFAKKVHSIFEATRAKVKASLPPTLQELGFFSSCGAPQAFAFIGAMCLKERTPELRKLTIGVAADTEEPFAMDCPIA